MDSTCETYRQDRDTTCDLYKLGVDCSALGGFRFIAMAANQSLRANCELNLICENLCCNGREPTAMLSTLRTNRS
jgi:hypothetical protein